MRMSERERNREKARESDRSGEEKLYYIIVQRTENETMVGLDVYVSLTLSSTSTSAFLATHPIVRTFRFGTEHTAYARNNRVLIPFKLTVRRDNTRFVTPYKTHCSVRNNTTRANDRSICLQILFYFWFPLIFPFHRPPIYRDIDERTPRECAGSQ